MSAQTPGRATPEIENTAESMKGPDALLFLAEAMGPDGDAGAIEGMEKRGQQQLVASARLPSDCGRHRAELESLGFTFGDPDPADPLFMPVTLPNGWQKAPSAHSMWSFVVDQHGRRRVAVFYKAAFYDRRAFMRLESVESYAASVVCEGIPLVLDEWATRDLVLKAFREEAARWREYAASDRQHGCADQGAEADAMAAKYDAAIAGLQGGTSRD